MEQWTHDAARYCPNCAARALWRLREYAVCVGCDSFLRLVLVERSALSAGERETIQAVRALAQVDSNSAVGAFG